MRRLCLLLAALSATGLVRAATNSPPASETSAATCLERLRTLQVQVGALEDSARAAGRTERLSCLAVQRAKLSVLLEMAQTAQAEWQRAMDNDDPESSATELAKISAVCDRADTVPAAVAACVSESQPESLKPLVPPIKPRKTNRTAAVVRRPMPAGAGEPECLRQDQWACLLARAMELVADDHAAPAECLAVLREHQIEPLPGWQPDRCSTLDDLSVTLARALKLSPTDNRDRPAGYLQALRDAGLPVDTWLPVRTPANPPPRVSEVDARGLLAEGQLAPLPRLRAPAGGDPLEKR